MEIKNLLLGRFVSAGFSKGEQLTAFKFAPSFKDNFTLSEIHKVTGYCSYAFLFDTYSNAISGILFKSLRSKTLVQPNKLIVLNDKNDVPNDYESIFTLERSGLIIYTSKDSSVLVVPIEVKSNLIIKAD